MSVVFDDGETVAGEIAIAESMAFLMSEERIKEKWGLLVGHALDIEAVEVLEHTILDLESLDDIKEMLRILKYNVHDVLDK